MVTSFPEGFCGLPQTFQGTARAATTDPSPTQPLTLAGTFAINFYTTHKTVLLVSITIRAPIEHLSNQFSSHSFHIDNTNNVIFPPLSANFHVLQIRLTEPVNVLITETLEMLYVPAQLTKVYTMSAPTKLAIYAMQTWLFHAIAPAQPRHVTGTTDKNASYQTCHLCVGLRSSEAIDAIMTDGSDSLKSTIRIDSAVLKPGYYSLH